MNTRHPLLNRIPALLLFAHALPCLALDLHVSPTGSDDAPGTRAAPFRSVHRAQAAVCALVADMKEDVVVNLAPGVYRLGQTLELTEASSGRNGFRVVYRSAGGLGKARLLGSVPLVGWQEHRDGIWKIEIPEGMLFHTLYERGKRAWKARFPNYEHHPEMPTARGRYLVSVDGSETSKKGETTGWLTYRPEDAPPVTTVTKMKLLLFSEGKCDWMRTVRTVRSIGVEARRVTVAGRFWRGVKARARFFFEDELGFLDAPGEFYVDEAAHTLYYKPMGEGHPDTLGIAAPVLTRLIQIKGKSRDKCAENLTLEGLALEETDGSTKGWWSTKYGRQDGALIWMSNTAHVEIRNCHLRNSGRSGIMMIGHNIGNLVTGCWIEHLGLNGVTLCNYFAVSDQERATPDRCERNRVHNCHIHDVGEIHTYAGCVNLFSVAHNEVSHCELHDSVRYAVTVRGNTGTQYGPPVWNSRPGTKGNRIHHLRVYRCGQDGGDMGALHCANLNNPDGDCINTFEQITVADSRAIPSMRDIGPDGIFLDWPKMSMHQIFGHVHIVRCQGRQIRSNGPDNAASAQTENVSWKPGFRLELMHYETIGLTAEFPAEYGGRPPPQERMQAPTILEAKAVSHDTIVLEWQAPEHDPSEELTYQVIRNDGRLSRIHEPRFVDRFLTERTAYGYLVCAREGAFTHFGALSAMRWVSTPADHVPPALTGVCGLPDGQRVRVAFSEPVTAATAQTPANYLFDPQLQVKAAKVGPPECVELEVAGLHAGVAYSLAVANIRDTSAAGNPVDAEHRIIVGSGKVIVSYPLTRLCDDRLVDASGRGANARLHGAAAVDPTGGPSGRAALLLDGETAYAEAPPDLNLGDGDFTIAAWIFREKAGTILSKGNGFGSLRQWSWGWQNAGVPQSISLRVNNNFLSTAPESVPDREWVHVAFVKRGDTGQAYVDGQPSGEPHDMSKLGPLVNDCPLRIGRRDYKPDPAFFKGKVAGLTLLNYAESPEWLAARVNSPADGGNK